MQTRIPGSSSSDQDDSESDVTENLQTVSVPTIDAFHLMQDVTYQHNKREWTVLTDLRSYEEDNEDYERGIEATIVTDISIAGPWSIYIEHIKFDNEVGQSDFDATIITWGRRQGAHARCIDTSLNSEGGGIFPGCKLFSRVSIT